MSCSGNDITRKIGDTYPIEATIKKETGSPYDLTGATNIILGVSSTLVVEAPAQPDLLLPGTISDALGGTVSFSISSNEANDLAVGEYFAEIQFEQSGYVITTETFRYYVQGQIVA